MAKSRNNTFIASIVRWASLALFLAIALRTMGIANEIVELAFGLILGAIAVAVALSYGLGGRDAAGEHFKEIIQRFREDKTLETSKSSSHTDPVRPKKDMQDPDQPIKPDKPRDPDKPGMDL